MIAGPQYDNTIPKDKMMTQYASKWLWIIAQHAAIIAARTNRDRPRAEKWESDWIGGKYTVPLEEEHQNDLSLCCVCLESVPSFSMIILILLS